jgi:hypothetical protein
MRPQWAALLLVFALSACGGGEAEGEGGPPTRAEFIARADELCAEHNEKLEQATEQLTAKPPPLSDDELDAFVADYADAYGDMAADLGDLERPRDDDAVERYMDGIERTAAGLEEAAEGEGNSDAVQQALQNSTREASMLAQDVGLEVCSSSPDI